MKILFIMTRAFNPYAAGVQRTTFKLGKYFTEQGLEVAYYSTKNKGNKVPEYGKLFYAQNSNDLLNPLNVVSFKNHLQSFHPDIVINQMPYDVSLSKVLFENKNELNYILLGCLRNSLFSFLNNIPEKTKERFGNDVYKFLNNKVTHAIIKHWHRLKHRGDLKRILNVYDRFVLLAPQNLDELQFFVGNYRNEKTKVIPNSIPSINYNARKHKKKQILFVGSLNVHQKRADILLPLWKEIYQQIPDWEFIIIGDGTYKNQLSLDILKLKLPRVSLKGHQQPEPYYTNASIFVMTSAYEGFPNTILEAHSFACPVVAFRSFAAIDWIVTDNVNACLSEPFDVKTMAQQVISLTRDSKKLDEMQNASLENAKRFTVDKVGQLWLDFFDELMSEHDVN